VAGKCLAGNGQAAARALMIGISYVRIRYIDTNFCCRHLSDCDRVL